MSIDDNSIESIQCRKWKAYLLKNILNTNNQDYFQGILNFMEYWSLIGGLENCPYNNSNEGIKLVQDYFSEDNYKYLTEQNTIWLKNEVKKIIQLECDVTSL